MPLGDDEDLERPDRPPGANNQKGVVLPDDTLAFFHLQFGVVRQEVPATVSLAILGHLHQLLPGLLWQRARRPYLTMRVGIAASHGSTLILEDLHVSQLMRWLLDCVFGAGRLLQEAELRSDCGQGVRGREVACVDARPCLDDGQNLLGRHVGERDVMFRAEGENVAFTSDRLGSQEERGDIWSRKKPVSMSPLCVELRQCGRHTIAAVLGLVARLLFLDSAVVVHEDEGAVVLGVGVALCALVPRT